MSAARPPRLLLLVDLARCADDAAWRARVEAAAGAAGEVGGAGSTPLALWLRPAGAAPSRLRRWIEALDPLRAAGLDVRIGAPPGRDAADAAEAGAAEATRAALALGWGLHRPAADPARGRPPELRGALGRSAHDARELRVAVAEGADAVVVGTVWPTASKPGHPGIGERGLARLLAAAEIADGTPPAAYAIGGVDADRAGRARQAGASGVALCTAVLEAADPAEATRDLLAALRQPAP